MNFVWKAMENSLILKIFQLGNSISMKCSIEMSGLDVGFRRTNKNVNFNIKTLQKFKKELQKSFIKK